MTSIFRATLCRLLMLSLAGLPLQLRAGMIGTGEVAAGAQAAARGAITRFAVRSDVAQRLQALGIPPEAARDRVNALDDREAALLAARLDSLPAGAGGEAAVVLLLMALLFWWFFSTPDRNLPRG